MAGVRVGLGGTARALRLLGLGAFLSFMVTDSAAGGGTENSVMPGDMPGNGPNRCSF